MADPTYPAFPIFAFLGFLLVLIPLPWHLEAWNSGTCYYMMWAAVACLNQFVNSIVWHKNALNLAPVWCDISSRIIVASSVGIPAASLCIQMRLFNIAQLQTVSVSRADKFRAILKDTLICVVFPMVYLVFYYIVQGHRFDVYEDVGCQPTVYDTLPSFFLVDIWPVIIGLISMVFCALSLRLFIKRRAQFTRLMASNSPVTINRYLRLMAMAFTEMLLTVPLGAYSIYLNATEHEVQPWISWTNVHYGFSRVGQVPAVVWHLDHVTVVAIELSRWSLPFCAILFFLFFGFAEEARRHYKLAFWWVMKPFGLKPSSRKSAKGTSGMKTGIIAINSSCACSPPAYSPSSRYSGKRWPESIAAPSTAAYSRSSFDMEKLPPLPSPAKTMEHSIFHGPSRSSPPSPTNSDCPTIDRLPFETDPDHHISISEAYVASRPTSSEFERTVTPAFHRPFSPPTVYPVPFSSAHPEETGTASACRDSEVAWLV